MLYTEHPSNGSGTGTTPRYTSFPQTQNLNIHNDNFNRPSQGAVSNNMRIKDTVDDLATLEILDEANVLNELQTRYSNGDYYTYIGDILVAINPCQPVDLYTEEIHARYKKLTDRRTEKPHIFWVADELYRNLTTSRDRENQCVIVSGESGAGKTETVNHLLKHLIQLGPNNVEDLVQQLDQVNPLLELFGNASTPLNKNSSRFCKLIELRYGLDGRLQNGQIQSFILEKSRLIQRHQNEKNFHIFYALLGVQDSNMRKEYNLGEVSDYRILVGENEMAGVFSNKEDFIEFKKKYKALETALGRIGFNDEEIRNIYNVLSAILNLTNIIFESNDDYDMLDFEDRFQVKCVAELLNIDDVEALEDSLLYTKLNVEEIRKHKTLAEANEGRDALAKELYQRLFSCIIDKINTKLRQSVPDTQTVQTEALPSINLLDISGFENLKVNGFEQLLINTANEVLHQIFLKHTIKREQEEYEKENVKWRSLEFSDNTDTIDLITKSYKGSRTSIFHILEDEASILTSTDMSLVRKLNKNFGENKNFVANTNEYPEFSIKHYADTVTYSAVGIIEKTKDTLSRCLRNIIQQSKNPLLQCYTTGGNLGRASAYLEPARTNDIGMKRNESLTSQFRTSLRQLQTKLNQSNLMFVRCLKPNSHLKPHKFDKRWIGVQLKACGLAEAANIRRHGFPVRINFGDFASRYKTFINGTDLSDYEKCKQIIKVSELERVHVGETKILLGYQEKEKLDFKLQPPRDLLNAPLSPSVRSSFSSNGRYQDGKNIDQASGTYGKSLNFDVPHQIPEPENEEIPDVFDSPFYQMDKSKIPAYDAFRETERDTDDDNDLFTKVLKAIRFLFYIFTICGIIASAVSHRLGLLLLSGAKNKEEGHSKLFLSFAIPMLFSWISNAMKSAFRGKVKPSLRIYLFIGTLEILRTIANCLVLFLFLPKLGMFRGIILLYGYGQIPSLLLLLETFFEKLKQSTLQLYLKRTIYFFIFILQLGIIPAYLFTDFLVWTKKGGNSPIDRLGEYRWLLPVVVLLISLSLWENYALFDIEYRKWKIPLNHWRKRVCKVRESTNFYIEPIKLVIFWVLSWQISGYDLEKCWESYTGTISDPIEHLKHFGVMYIEIVSAVICNYLAAMACKLHMQKCGFALPLILVPPITIAMSFVLCEKEWSPQKVFMMEFQCCKLDFLNELLIPIIIMAVAWITTILITIHIWRPKSERMAQFSKLFVPMFDPLLLDYSLLNRRRQDQKENVEKTATEATKRPTLLVCATTWHETRQEMVQLLKSLFRLDFYQGVTKIRTSGIGIEDSYDLEIHIIFDDAWEIDEKSGQEVPNSFVNEFVSLIPEAVTSVAKGIVPLKPITKITTPYGGRLEMILPGDTKMVIHLKNKERIRHRKRWSQVMYLYYLLGFKMFGDKNSVEDLLLKDQEAGTKVKRTISILNHLPDEEYKKIESTFLLTLDGDVDFKQESVKLLLDRMLKNKKVGAVCGRIHPIGSGPMIWYQQFEYAVGHWLQKAAEHIFGCVLCCPGCFSLFRASAIMDDNVMRAYTRKPIVARDFIQYEQGEDRWLCTLLLQQGYKIDYCAGADAYTFAPESFHDFYIQRRRWAPSTIANIMDLLSTWHTTVKLNDNISVFFMFYQFILMTSSILAPATVVLMIAGSYNAVLKISMWWSFVVSLIPVLLYIFICLKKSTNTQIKVAAFMTSIYSVVMVIVTVGTIISILQDDLVAPNVVFLAGLSVVFSMCGILHPREIFCLIHGILYFLTVPSSFIFLTIYFLCNLNIVSWGTREVPKKLTPEEEEEAKKAEAEKLKKKKEKSFFNVIGLLPLIEEIKKIIQDLLGRQQAPDPNAQATPDVENQKAGPSRKTMIAPVARINSKVTVKPKLDPYYWTTLPTFGAGESELITESEKKFWIYILKKYLHPLQENKEEKEKIKADLESTRNNVVFGYFLLNLLWSVAIMQLQTMKEEMLPFFIAGKYEPISVIFLSIFGIVLILQFIGMCMHRWGTFLHLMSTTHLLSDDAEQKRRLENKILKMATASTNIDIERDYSSDEGDYNIEEDLPEIDYDSEPNTYEQFYIDRRKNTVRQRDTHNIRIEIV